MASQDHANARIVATSPVGTGRDKPRETVALRPFCTETARTGGDGGALAIRKKDCHLAFVIAGVSSTQIWRICVLAAFGVVASLWNAYQSMCGFKPRWVHPEERGLWERAFDKIAARMPAETESRS